MDIGMNLKIIIPYQEINGNYNNSSRVISSCTIIPYQEINGNYNTLAEMSL